jgi:hypothetical protein
MQKSSAKAVIAMKYNDRTTRKWCPPQRCMISLLQKVTAAKEKTRRKILRVLQLDVSRPV